MRKQQGARLGQHFLKNPHYAELLVREAGITAADIALEIGPGEGALTRFLLQSARKTIVVEKDEALTAKLHSTFASELANGRLEIVAGDARDFQPENVGLEAGNYILAANIPYYITGELIRKFLETSLQPRTIAFLVQKEVAQRIIADKESILSISVKAYGTPRIAAKVSKGNFNPPPSVDSAILVIDQISKKNFQTVSEENFFNVVRTGFASKRKLLASNLSIKFDKEKVTQAFSRHDIDAKARAETIHLREWLAIAAEI